VRPETIQMIADAIDQAGAMFLSVSVALCIATTVLVVAALFVTLGLIRLWRWMTVGSWTSAIRSAERKAFE
jgi:hypothetical protein